jgi:hypothetical protein
VHPRIPQVAAHFAAHSAALRALSAPPSPSQRRHASGSDRGSGSGACEAPSVRLGLVGDCMWVRDTWTRFLSPATRAAAEACAALVGNLETPLHATMPRDPLWLAQVRVETHILCATLTRERRR